MTMQISSYVQQLAQVASGICGLDPNVILAQWDCEEGIQSVSQWPNNNPAGITSGNSAVDALSVGTNSYGFLIFPTPLAGAQGYATLYKTDPNYAGVRAAIPGGPAAQIQAIVDSPWDAGHYQEGGYNHLSSAYDQITGSNVSVVADTAASGYPTGSPGGQINNQIVFPPTNYSIVANSQKTGDVLYGRRYRVLVSDSRGIALDVSDLHCIFNIQYVINQTPPFSTVEIYNLNPQTENAIMDYGARVVVEAGYEGNQYGVIFDGDLAEAIRDRPDNVSDRLTLYAITGNSVNAAFANFTVARGQSQRSVLQQIAAKASVPTPLGELSPMLSDVPLPRGKSVFGLTRDYIRQIARSSNLAPYYGPGGVLNMVHASDPPKGTIMDLTPDTGLINTPTQTGIGVSFDSLLNPAITIGTMVHIDSLYIQAQAFQIGQVQRPLDAQGIYRVTGVTHSGDTRGSAWQTSCTSVSQLGSLPANITTASGNAYGG